MVAIARRELLGGIGAAAAIGVAAPALAAHGARARIDFNDPQVRFRAYMQMRGALDERLVIGYISGSYFGVVGAEVTPLWDVVGVTFARYRRRSDGGYDGFSGEIAHFFDPKTGKAPGRFLNPYTGKINIDPRTNLPPAKIVLLPTMTVEVAAPRPGMTFDHEIRAPQVRGDDVWFTEVSRVAMQFPGGARPFNYSEMVTMHARVRDLANPGAMRVPCEGSFTNVVNWRPWMEMGDHPGHLTAVGTGRYGVSMADLPANWTEATREKFPAVLDDPGALLAAIYKAG